MGRYVFNLPDVGEGIAEAEIVAWHVKPGDMVEEDDQIADMMTDKATVEMESPVTGKVLEVAGDVGDIIAIGSMLIVVETEGEDSVEVDADEQEAKAPVVPKEVPVVAAEVPSIDEPVIQDETPHSTDIKEQKLETGDRKVVLATPAVRQRAKELGVDLSQVKAQGEHIRHSDLDNYLNYGGAQGYRPVGASANREDESIKVIGMRRRIAQNMAESKRNIPHFSYVEEIDVTALEDMRADLNANRGDRPKLTMLPLLIVAICKTIPEFPMINARFDDEAGVVTRHGDIDLGMATQTDAGLMVPVIRQAQNQNVWQLANEISRLANAARDGSAKSDELSGSTLTITSLGPLGGIATTPVINRPEVAIIGPNKIVERPVIIDGEIEARKLMNLSISCDHRVVDGWDAASFVQALKKLVEKPVFLFTD